MRQSEEPRENAHGDRVGSFPTVNWLNIFPLLLLDKGHERVHVTGSGVATELSICDVEDSWQGSNEESSRQPRIVTRRITGNCY